MGVCDKYFVGLIGVSSPSIFLLEVWQVVGLGVCWLVGGLGLLVLGVV